MSEWSEQSKQSEQYTQKAGEQVLRAERLVGRYGQRIVLHHVSLAIAKGEWVGIIGPNGSGKSTLLALLSGAEVPAAGSVSLFGKPIPSYKRKELARSMAVLQQEALPAVGYTVRDVVEMGRFPYQKWFGTESEDSGPFIDLIMEQLQLTAIEERPLDQLSGGQRQRVALGKLMAQSPDIVLLDEPTTYLDIHHQVQFLDIVREWQRTASLTVVSVLHDLNLASLYCDRLVVMNEGQIVAEGKPEEVITEQLLADIFATRTSIVQHPEYGRPQVLVCTNE
ncbi:ABC transporter ATP-binding protein [Paenibacillus sp. 481]|uniref:ABC transporter ATP-binding protein n=1 Tax=Paenibacillus sp. 481 TaxID=2835869 RepID=UPI001E4F0C54|nr:ABC transporter ATP-binding protein [Paenibacillus sp. 481]UHA76102.1 ABC transporter ATP-binding protein [Paenibacillus sp. 481]